METKEKKDEMWGTKEVAAKLKVTPSLLRRALRSAGKNTEGEYTHYEWAVGSDLSKVQAILDKYGAAKAAKAPTKKASAKKAATSKKKASSKKEEVADEGGEAEI